MAPTSMNALPRMLMMLGLAASLGVAGCSTFYEVEDPDLGASVRNMVALQTSYPDQGAEGLDGEKAEKILRAYRGDTVKPESVEKTTIIQL